MNVVSAVLISSRIVSCLVQLHSYPWWRSTIHKRLQFLLFELRKDEHGIARHAEGLKKKFNHM